MSEQESFLPVTPTNIKFPKWASQANYRTVTAANIREALKELVVADVVAWDSEFDSTHSGQIVSAFSFSTAPMSGWLLPVRMDHIENIRLDLVKKFVYAISRKTNVVQAGGAEMRSVKHTWPEDWEDICNITHDIQVMWFQRDPNEAKDFKESAPRRRGQSMPVGFSLEAMALKYLKLETPSLKDYFKDHSFRELDPETARIYACADSDVTLRLFQAGADPAMLNSFIYKLDMSMVRVLMDMEEEGILYDPERQDEVERDVRVFVTDTRVKAYEKLGISDPDSVNIDSPKQLARYIFNVLNWPIIGKRTKDGLGSTDKNAMARYSESADLKISEAANAIREYKKWKTLHNNFLTKLHQYRNPVTGAIHCSFLGTVVPTGRLACASPNLQQIPRKTAKEAPLRRAFRARPNCYFLEADYSQIELRVYAGETQEKYFFDAFAGAYDLHLRTASIIFREEIINKKDPRRDFGKVMNFGPIYGMKPEGLAMRTDYTLQEAERILDDFFGAMPDAVRWTRDVHRQAKERGGVHTHFGRWRPLPWINSRIPHEVEFGERSAVNTIVQGTAADIMKIGLVRLWKTLRKTDCPFHNRVRMILTVHDSVMLEAQDSVDPHELLQFVREQLCFDIPGYPPLEIDAKIGRNWHDTEDLEEETPIPEAEEVKDEHHELPLPTMAPEQVSQLIDLVKRAAATPGNHHVVLVGASGPMNGGKPVVTDGYGYQSILKFLVGIARVNSVPTSNLPQKEDALRVSFA